HANILDRDQDIRRLDLVLNLPGFLQALNEAEADSKPIPTLAAELAKAIGSGGQGNVPRAYLEAGDVPAAIQDRLATILAPCSRLEALRAACETAYRDTQAYPDDNEGWSNFAGPKNVVVFTKWPVVAYLLQLWAESKLDGDSYQSGLLHSGMTEKQRMDLIDWFGLFIDEEDGSPKARTKILFSTYELGSTGLDGLKVANYLVHYGVNKNVIDVSQASGRVDRQGQPLTCFIQFLQSSEQPLDRLTLSLRDSRDSLFGQQGILGEIAGWSHSGDAAAQ
ncbi:hypothetical protein CSUB01_12625, partial [Colletotrichum sublineola]